MLQCRHVLVAARLLAALGFLGFAPFPLLGLSSLLLCCESPLPCNSGLLPSCIDRTSALTSDCTLLSESHGTLFSKSHRSAPLQQELSSANGCLLTPLLHNQGLLGENPLASEGGGLLALKFLLSLGMSSSLDFHGSLFLFLHHLLLFSSDFTSFFGLCGLSGGVSLALGLGGSLLGSSILLRLG